MGYRSRFWVDWAGVLVRSLVEYGWLVEFKLAFYSLVCWLVEFFLFYFILFFHEGAEG